MSKTLDDLTAAVDCFLASQQQQQQQHPTSTSAAAAADDDMILDPVSFLDCVIFALCAIPQLLLRVGWIQLVISGLKALPFVFFRLPLTILRNQWTAWAERWRQERAGHEPHPSPSAFADMCLQLTRYGAVNFPPQISRVLCSKEVAIPYFTFRLIRHGYYSGRAPIPWEEVNENGVRGIWINRDPATKPDLVLYYAHGGGFVVGSPHFYLEFLLHWTALLRAAGYVRPAIFALHYTLVPDATYPTQVNEAMRGYAHVLSATGGDASVVCFGGDSAGATLMLSVLLRLGQPRGSADSSEGGGNQSDNGMISPDGILPKPAFAVLLSPWSRLVSARYRNTEKDFLDAEQICRHGLRYVGGDGELVMDPLASPGHCQDLEWWRQSSPAKGIFIMFGSDEVFSYEIQSLAGMFKEAGVLEGAETWEGGIHVGPVVDMFYGRTCEERIKGLVSVTGRIRKHIPHASD